MKKAKKKTQGSRYIQAWWQTGSPECNFGCHVDPGTMGVFVVKIGEEVFRLCEACMDDLHAQITSCS